MPIDINREELITFCELARSLPARRNSRPIHIATVHRWRAHGLKGVRLEAVRVGGAWHTTREAFRRFADRLTALALASEGTLPNGPSDRRNLAANDALEQRGW